MTNILLEILGKHYFFLGGAVYVSYLAFCPEARKGCGAKPTCNQKIRLNEAKVVDMIDIEDIAEKAAFCRWLVFEFTFHD